jgi:hypothetical protein
MGRRRRWGGHGLAAISSIGERTSLNLCYEGEIQGKDNSHAGTIGVRFTG